MARFIEWTDAISVGDPVLDAQHRLVFDIINDLYAMMSSTAPPDQILRILRRLKFFTLTHFQCEQLYMLHSGCTFLAEHKKAHHEMAATVDRYIAEHRRAHLDPTDLLRFLKTWWLDHIRKADTEYVSRLPAIGDRDL